MKLQKFERYEFKYILNENLRKKIQSDVSKFMRVDKFANKNKKYFVRSLYFDDDVSTEYYNKIDGMKIRRKFRLRTYGRDFSKEKPIFLELKGRYNQRTYKRRKVINIENLYKYENEEISKIIKDDEFKDNLGQNFLFEKIRRNLKPKVITDYWRCPFISDYDRNFRVTFDDNLKIKKTPRLFNNNQSFLRSSLPGYSILEIKFDRRIPKWFHRIIQSYNLRKVSISKFCVGMETADIAINLE